MLLHRNIFWITFIMTIALPLNGVWADVDMLGSKDHPKIPRIADSTIIGFAESGYDEGVFMAGATGNQLNSENIEGKRTRVMYVAPKDLSTLGILRNYQKAFDDLGEVEEVYTCKGHDCFRNLGDIFIWHKSNRLPNNIGKKENYFWSTTREEKDQTYWYGKIKTPESLYHVSIYSAIVSSKYLEREGLERFQHHPVIQLEVVEVTDFKPTLEVVKAEDMTSKINEKGHIALYGIHFDSDSDTLKPESDPALEEIAKALKADTALKIYVAGHTDNKGTLEYNEDLSKRRAQAVVKALTSKYGIPNDRLVPVGVGPASPVATNKTEEGRTLNRRVELVER